MNPFILGANSNIASPYVLPRAGRMRCVVASDRAVSAFVVDDVNLAEFRAGNNYSVYGGHGRLQNHNVTVRLPRGRYYVLIINWSNQPAAVSCEVYVSTMQRR